MSDRPGFLAETFARLKKDPLGMAGLVIVVVILLPGVVLYWWTALPGKVVIPRGPADGRHQQIMDSLKRAMEKNLGVKTTLQDYETPGSYKNLRSLQDKQRWKAMEGH